MTGISRHAAFQSADSIIISDYLFCLFSMSLLHFSPEACVGLVFRCFACHGHAKGSFDCAPHPTGVSTGHYGEQEIFLWKKMAVTAVLIKNKNFFYPSAAAAGGRLRGDQGRAEDPFLPACRRKK
jgi:hypothetical protein